MNHPPGGQSIPSTGVAKPAHPRFDPAMSTFDVIIVGLGGMGSAAACHLAGRGLRVLGLDRFDPPHDRGSSHGSTRVIRQAYFEHPAYVPLLLRAYEGWRNLERASGQPLLLLPGGLMIGPPDSEVVSGSLRSARLHGLPHQLLEAAELRRRFPAFRLPETHVALFEEAAGLVFCEKAIRAHLDLAARRGASLRFQSPVLQWRVRPGGVEVVTTQGTDFAGRLVLTPGPWAPELLRDLGLPLTVERQVLCWFDPPGGIALFQPDRFPIYIWQRSPNCSPYGFPAVDGNRGGVKIALYRSPETETCTPESVDRKIRNSDETNLREVIREFLPALDGPLLRATTCLYTLTPDLHFIIDRHPAHPEVIVAGGFSGHGFKFCSVVGEMIADLVTDRAPACDLSLFRSTRFTRPS